MPKSKNDPHKRKCAQALNHLANAVIDVNEVYEAFDASIQRMIDADVENGTTTNVEAIERYKVYRESFKEVMMYIVVPRSQLVELVGRMWGLDEETIRVYLG